MARRNLLVLALLLAVPAAADPPESAVKLVEWKPFPLADPGMVTAVNIILNDPRLADHLPERISIVPLMPFSLLDRSAVGALALTDNFVSQARRAVDGPVPLHATAQDASYAFDAALAASQVDRYEAVTRRVAAINGLRGGLPEHVLIEALEQVQRFLAIFPDISLDSPPQPLPEGPRPLRRVE